MKGVINPRDYDFVFERYDERKQKYQLGDIVENEDTGFKKVQIITIETTREIDRYFCDNVVD